MLNRLVLNFISLIRSFNLQYPESQLCHETVSFMSYDVSILL